MSKIIKSKVFFNIDFGTGKNGQIIFDLFDNVTPKTA
jgi:hypothetical protein